MNLKLTKVEDNIQNGVARVYHSTKTADLADIIKNGKFNTGSGAGSMIGNGFYCNLQLYQAMKGNYGKNILMAEVHDLSRFIIVDYAAFERVYGTASDADHFIDYQQENKFKCSLDSEGHALRGVAPVTDSAISNKARRLHGGITSSAQYAAWLNNVHIRTHCRVKPVGFIYRGDYDGLSMVCWYPEIYINPIQVSLDQGKTWTPVNDVDFESSIKERSKGASEGFQKQPEYLRSIQRANDLKEKLRGNYFRALPHIENHLSRIKNQEKFDLRKKAFQEVFPDIATQIEKIKFTDSLQISDASSSELKKALAALGIDPAGMSVKQMEEALSHAYWEQSHPGEEYPDQFDPMLAKDATKNSPEDIDKMFSPDNYVAQEKINGMRSILNISGSGKVNMTSRSRSKKDYMFTPHNEKVFGFNHDINNPLGKKIVLDGELFSTVTEIDTGKEVTYSPLQAVVALTHAETSKSLSLQEKYNNPLVYKAFDCLFFDGEDIQSLPYTERYKKCQDAVAALIEANPELPIECVPLEEFTSAYQLFRSHVDKGHEGVMMKRKDFTYQQGKRSADMSKLKGVVDVDGFITGIVPASEDKAFKDLIGGFEFSAYVDGKPQVIANVSNIPMKIRQEATILKDGRPQLNPDYLNRCAALVGQEFGKNGRMGSARISVWRDDKDPEDCQLTAEDVKPKEW